MGSICEGYCSHSLCLWTRFSKGMKMDFKSLEREWREFRWNKLPSGLGSRFSHVMLDWYRHWIKKLIIKAKVSGTLSQPLYHLLVFKSPEIDRQNHPLFPCNPTIDMKLSKSKVSKWEQTTPTLYWWPHAPLVPGLSYTFWPFFWYNLHWEVFLGHWKLLQGVSVFSHFRSKLHCSACHVRSSYSGRHLGSPCKWAGNGPMMAGKTTTFTVVGCHARSSHWSGTTSSPHAFLLIWPLQQACGWVRY